MAEYRFYVCRRDSRRCKSCGLCSELIFCPGLGSRYRPSEGTEHCIGCQVCYQACPNYAIELVPDELPRKEVEIVVGGEKFAVPERITIKQALELLGYSSSPLPGAADLYVPCGLGGCYACAVLVDGELEPCCITPVREGMRVDLDLPPDLEPLRRVSGYMAHTAGGVGTPWWVKGSGRYYIEVACFAHGCNLRCPQCQNSTITYNNVEPPSTPREAAETLTAYRRRYGLDRMAISGGEPTLNRPWLLSFFRELRKLNPDGRLHLDTNASILSPDYVDELVEAGMTDIGPDLKGLRTETFMRITGITDEGLARRYLENAWSIVKYIVDRYYPERVFMGVGIPYNSFFITLEEIREIGDRLYAIDPELQVTLLDYRPAFRRWEMRQPSLAEMRRVREVLLESGLKTVLAQTAFGTIGP